MRDVSASTLPVRGTCFGCFAPEGRGFDWTPEGGLPPELVQDVMTDGAVAAGSKRGRSAVCVMRAADRGAWRHAVRNWGSGPEDEEVVLVVTDGDAVAAAGDVDPDA